jgi:hypothetical protein
MAGTSYILEGGSDLEKHAGHQIEVTGTLVPASTGASGAAGAGAAGAGATSGAGSTSASAAAPQHLKVTSVRMISATCS